MDFSSTPPEFLVDTPSLPPGFAQWEAEWKLVREEELTTEAANESNESCSFSGDLFRSLKTALLLLTGFSQWEADWKLEREAELAVEVAEKESKAREAEKASKVTEEAEKESMAIEEKKKANEEATKAAEEAENAKQEWVEYVVHMGDEWTIERLILL